MKHSNIDQYNSLDGIPAMTSEQVHLYLEQLGREWLGQGVAMELGCWLGASSIALLKGLVLAGYNKEYWAFDAWYATQDQIPKARQQGVVLKLGQDIRELFLQNVTPIYEPIFSCKGSLPRTLNDYNGSPIEICLFDAPKTEPTFTDCINALKPYWIPGVTVLGLLDYDFYLRHAGEKRQRFRAPVNFMEKYGDNFKLEKEWQNEAVKFFRYMKVF